MKKIVLLSFCLAFLTLTAQERKLPIDTTVVTKHNTTVKGVSFQYTAKTGTQPVWDENGEPIASLFYTYYTRDDIKDRAIDH